MYWLVCIWYSAPLVNDVPLALFKWSFLGKLLKRHAWSVWYVDLEKRFRFCPGPDYLRIFLIEFSQPIGEGIPCSCRQKKNRFLRRYSMLRNYQFIKGSPPQPPNPKKLLRIPSKLLVHCTQEATVPIRLRFLTSCHFGEIFSQCKFCKDRMF